MSLAAVALAAAAAAAAVEPLFSVGVVTASVAAATVVFASVDAGRAGRGDGAA